MEQLHPGVEVGGAVVAVNHRHRQPVGRRHDIDLRIGAPVVMLEHKGLYWSKVEGTDDAKTIEPSKDYILPLGKGAVALQADAAKIKKAKPLPLLLTEWACIGQKMLQKNFRDK